MLKNAPAFQAQANPPHLNLDPRQPPSSKLESPTEDEKLFGFARTRDELYNPTRHVPNPDAISPSLHQAKIFAAMSAPTRRKKHQHITDLTDKKAPPSLSDYPPSWDIDSGIDADIDSDTAYVGLILPYHQSARLAGEEFGYSSGTPPIQNPSLT
jgi:hypothetical protein